MDTDEKQRIAKLSDAEKRAEINARKCRACGITVREANAGAFDCPDTNDYEHDFPGVRRFVTIELVK